LVLARKAATERWQESIANWLFGVARRLALKARAAAARRHVVEHGAAPRTTSDPLADITARELQTVLDEELTRLPEKYRAPILLCCLEGHARDEAAQQLGWTLPTLKSRLEQARDLLRRRLTRRGLTLSASLAALTLAHPASAASFPTALAKMTCQAALALIAGNGAASSLISPSVAALVGGATRAVFLSKARITTVLLIAATIAAVGGGLLIDEPAASGVASAPRVAQDSTPGGTGTPAGQQARNPEPRPDDQGDQVTVSGRVLDPDGKPFEGAELTVCRYDRNRAWLKPAKPKVLAKSGADGRFAFTIPKSAIDDPSVDSGMPYNEAWLQVVAAADGYAPVWESIRNSQPKELTLSLARDDMPIEGRVVDLQGRPVKGASVRIVEFRTLQHFELYQYVWKGLPENVTTDKDGRFRLSGLGRSRMVRLSINEPTIERVLQYIPTVPGLYNSDGKSATVEIIAGPTKVITGVVRAKDTGKPLAGMRVHGQSSSDDFPLLTQDGVRTVTDENGRYRLVGLPKTAKYLLRVFSDDSQSTYLPKWLELAGTEGLKPIIKDFDLQRGAALRLRFIDNDTGKPVLGIVHYCPCYDNPRYEEARTGSDRRVHRIYQPDHNGLFNFLVVPGPSVIVFTAGLPREDVPYLPAELDPEDLKAHPLLTKRPPFAGGLADSGCGHAYRIIDAQPSDQPLTLDIRVRPKH
jgi:protocatechuate 3,4-dioxygenase beta subunit